MDIEKYTSAFVCLKRYSGTMVILVHKLFFEYVFGNIDTTLYGLLANHLGAEQITDIRNTLVKIGKNTLKQRFGEKIFIYSFIAASGAFFLLFFFMSIVIRDPIPVIDELLVSTAASIGIYFFVRRRMRIRLGLNTIDEQIIPRISSLRLTINATVKNVENVLYEYDMLDAVALQALKKKKDPRLSMISAEDAGFLETLLTAYSESAEFRVQRRKNRKLFKHIFTGADADLPLVVLIDQLKKIATPT